MINVGRKLGLYQHLMTLGKTTAALLAEKSGLHERWLLEWLRLQTAAEILLYTAPDTFELPQAGITMLADESQRLCVGRLGLLVFKCMTSRILGICTTRCGHSPR